MGRRPLDRVRGKLALPEQAGLVVRAGAGYELASDAMKGEPLMRRIGIVAVFSLLLPMMVIVPPIEAVSTPLVDAGVSVKADIGQSFPLDGFVEGFAASVTTAWTGPGSCTISAPASLATTASCSKSGVHDFTLSGDDGGSAATDGVRVVVYDEWTQEYVKANGTTIVGASNTGFSNDELHTSGIPFPFDVSAGTRNIETRLSSIAVAEEGVTVQGDDPGAGAANDFDLALIQPNNEVHENSYGSSSRGLETESVRVDEPMTGAWRAEVRTAMTPIPDSWEIEVTGVVRAGDASLPYIRVPRAVGTTGSTVALNANTTGGTAPYSIAWETSPDSRAFDDGTGAAFSFTFGGATTVRAKVTDAEGFEAVASVFVRDEAGPSDRTVTVVAVIDPSGFSPYHYEFLGHQHPWNRDADLSNDFDFYSDPATYIDGFPGAKPVNISIPTSPAQSVEELVANDEAEWKKFEKSFAGSPKLVWFPGTKIVGAMKFSADFVPSRADEGISPPGALGSLPVWDWLPQSPAAPVNDVHGARSAASAAGNWLGACPDCVFVLLQGDSAELLKWAAAQSWIDVVTNSYGHNVDLYLGSPINATRAAAEAGQVIVFSAGNGIVVPPTLTPVSSDRAPDWIVTVGSVSPSNQQTYTGSGKPVDISSIGRWYPSTGGALANGTGKHDGTSNAAPVVAGHFAKVLQRSRELLGDTTVTHAGGIVASGTSVACGASVPSCALGDGVLTRRELRDLVFRNVLPSKGAIAPLGLTWPTTPLAYTYQGHGVLVGRMDEARYEADWQRMVAVATGDAMPLPRPAGEENWFTAYSKCRQRLWGTWSGGYYNGVDPTFDPVTDTPAIALNAWCSQLPPDTMYSLMEAVPG